ncbi:MAG: hypothetical protein Q8L01_01890 [Candidatus Woesebacteria bacterium]|nr:hypothetical protein [Candidatus Woesebacteria bacterium]
MIRKELLEKLYFSEKRSMQEIADLLGFSLHKVAYWVEKHKIKSRSRSEAIYIKHNPKGDPFSFKPPETKEEAILFGMGLGLYWGEGTKASKSSVRLGNTDPKLLLKFIEFLERFYSIKRKDMKFGLQVFSDMKPRKSLDFWAKSLKINSAQFNKIIVTKSGSLGTYRKKTEYGVLTVMFHNTKLRNLIVATLPM